MLFVSLLCFVTVWGGVDQQASAAVSLAALARPCAIWSFQWGPACFMKVNIHRPLCEAAVAEKEIPNIIITSIAIYFLLCTLKACIILH